LKYYLFLIFTILLLLTTTIIIPVNGSFNDYLTLKDLQGKEFMIFYVKRIYPSSVSQGTMKYDTLSSWLIQVLYLVSNDPYSITKKLRLEGISNFNDEKIYVYHGVLNNTDIIVALGDLGHFYIRVGDGRANVYVSCNSSYNYDENILSAIRGRLPDKPEILKIKWSGQYSEEAYMRIGKICNKTNNTITCYIPSNQSINKVLYNPYEVYYICIYGYRIEPPLRIRCCDPRYNNGLLAVYVEGFIPTLTNKVDTVIIDNEYLSKIIDIVKSMGLKINSYDELIVENTYLTLGVNDKLVPIIILRYGNIRILIELDRDKPVLRGYASFSNLSKVNKDIDEGIKIDWNNILSSISRQNTNNQNIEPIYYYLVFLALAIIIATIIYLLRRKG
jgi:hypothetical protein